MVVNFYSIYIKMMTKIMFIRMMIIMMIIMKMIMMLMMKMIMMLMMNMIIEIKRAITGSILKLGTLDFTW